MVVAETTKYEGKSCADTISGSLHIPSPSFLPSRFTTLASFLTSCSLFPLSLNNLIQAQDIVDDKNVPKTQEASILQTGNDTPQINIHPHFICGFCQSVPTV